MRRTLTVIAVALITSLGLVGSSSAAAGSHGSHAKHRKGYTQVAVDPAVLTVLTTAKVTLAPVKGAKAEGGVVKFPITAVALKGKKIHHHGGISLTSADGTKQIVLRSFTVNLKRGIVTAKASGTAIGTAGRAPIFTIVTPSAHPELGDVGLALTAPAASALNTTFGSSFKAGDVFGYATVKRHATF